MSNKILFISSEFPPGPGGIGNHAYNIANELTKKGYQVIINTKSDYVDQNQEVMFDDKCQYKIYRFKKNKTIIHSWINRIIRIRKTILKYNIERVIISGEFSIWTIPFVKIYKGIKITTVVHGTELGRNLFLKWTYFCLGKSNQIISVSNFTKTLIPKFLKRKTHVINNGIDVDKWNGTDQEKSLVNYPILLTVGSISIRKGQYNVIKILPQIIKEFPLTHYHCIGNDENKKEIIKLIKKYGLNNNVTLHGIIKHSELEKFYKIAHVNMMLSNNNNNTDFEGYGISVLEGNLYGVPAIGAKKSGLEDAIIDQHNGKLVNPSNEDEVVESLKIIFMNYISYSYRSKSHANENKWSSKISKYEKYIYSE